MQIKMEPQKPSKIKYEKKQNEIKSKEKESKTEKCLQNVD